jgi:spermidine synthase
MSLVLAAIGFVSLVGQVILLRELNVALYGSELAYILALGLWLLGTASGASVGRATPPLSRSAVAGSLLVAGLLLPCAICFVRASHVLFGGVPGAFLPFGLQLAAIAIAVAPMGALTGRLFRLAAAIAVAGGRSPAAAYGLECVGSAAGGVAATTALHLGLSNARIGFACASLCAISGAVILVRERPGRTLRVGGPALAAIVTALLAAASPVDRAMTLWTHPGLLESRDTPYGRTTVTMQEGQVAVFQDGALAYETQGTAAEELVHLAAAQCERPARILILGGGDTGLAAEALKHGPREIVTVEIDRRGRDLLLRCLPATLLSPLRDAAVRVAYADPRRFLADGRAGEKGGPFDLILVGMPEPSSGRTNRFFTREFHAECAACLAPGGVLAFALPASENYWTPPQTRRASSLAAAMRSVFSDVLVLPGATSVFLGSAAPLARDPDVLSSRLRDRGVRARLVGPEYLRYRYTNDKVAAVEAAMHDARVPANSDSRPVCYSFTLMIWLSKFYPELARLNPLALEARSTRTWAAVVLAGVALAGLIVSGRRVRGRGLAVFLAGAGGIVLESVLLLAYQSRCGALFQDLGLLLTAFMLGMAGGSALFGLHDRRSPARATPDRPARPAALLLVSGLAACAFGLALRLRAGWTGGLVETGFWMAAAGAITAAIFAWAAARAKDPARALGPLYAADLLGGCAGSLVAGLILVPLAGLPETAFSLGAVAAMALAWI